MRKPLKRSIGSLSVLLLLCGCGNGCGGKKPNDLSPTIVSDLRIARLNPIPHDLKTVDCRDPESGEFIDCVQIPLDEYLFMRDQVEEQSIDLIACCIALGGSEADCTK